MTGRNFFVVERKHQMTISIRRVCGRHGATSSRGREGVNEVSSVRKSAVALSTHHSVIIIVLEI